MAIPKQSREEMLAQRKEYREVNKEKLASKYTEWYKKNKDKVSKQKKIYRKKNREKLIKQKRAWNKANKDNIVKYRRARRKINAAQERDRNNQSQQYRLSNLLRNRLFYAFRNFSINGKVNSSKKYGINFQLIFEHIGPMPDDGQKYHIDHIVPLCSFNFDDSEEIKTAFAPENHQWLTAEENLKKGSKIL